MCHGSTHEKLAPSKPGASARLAVAPGPADLDFSEYDEMRQVVHARGREQPGKAPQAVATGEYEGH